MGNDPLGFGIVVLDDREQPHLYVALATDDGPADASRLAACRQQAAVAPSFVMLVSAGVIRVYDQHDRLAARLDTGEVLRVYHADFEPWRATPRYLICLLEAWLSDLACGWRGGPPPGLDQLRAAGLAEPLSGSVHHVVPDESGSLRP